MSKNYEKAAKQKSLLGEITRDLETKGDLKNTTIETVKDIVVGVVAGGVAGSAIGRASLIIGAAVTGIGHYYKSRLGSIFGVGMMAANGFQQSGEMKGTPKEGLEGVIEGVKERVLSFKDTFSEKLYLDKVLKKDKKEDDKKSVGEVQYFTYEEKKNKELGTGEQKEELDLTALDNLEKQVADSGAKFSQNQNNSGSGTGNLPANEMGALDPTEQNY